MPIVAPRQRPYLFPLAIVFLALTLLGLLGFVCLNFLRLYQVEQGNAQTYQLRLETRSLLESLINMETGARGFVLTGHDVFLDPYDHGAATFGQSLRLALNATRGDQTQQANLYQLERRKLEWQRLYSPVLKLRVLTGPRAAIRRQVQATAEPQLEQRRHHMERMRALLEVIEAREASLLARRQAQAATLWQLTERTLWGGTALAVFLAVGLSLLLFLSERHKARANRQLHAEIAEHERTTAALGASEEKFRLLVEKATDIFSILGPDGGLLYESPAAEHWLGYTPGGRDGDSVFSFVHPQDLPRVQAAFNEVRASPGSTVRVEFRHRHRDGSWRRLESCGTQWQSGAMRGSIVVISRDVTERHKIESLKNEFIATVSHELRTPLTAIRGSLGLLAGGVTGELPDKARGMVTIAHQNSERLLRLVNDVLDVEKMASGKMEFAPAPLDIVPFLNRAVSAHRAYGDQFGVRFEIANQSPESDENSDANAALQVHADDDRLMQVMANLLSNAAKFSPPGEAVTIAATRRGDAVRVEVRDRGAGIPAEFQSRIFEKFAQADVSDARRKGGTGLGLNISRSIVEHSGGIIGFETAPGAGTTFYFELPEYFPQYSALGSAAALAA